MAKRKPETRLQRLARLSKCKVARIGSLYKFAHHTSVTADWHGMSPVITTVKGYAAALEMACAIGHVRTLDVRNGRPQGIS